MDFEEIIKAFFAAANRRDLKAMDDLFSEEIEFYFPRTQPLIGKERVLRFFTILFRQYPQLTFHVHMTITEANKGAVHWTNKGANRRGDAYKNEGVTILRLKNNRICFLSDFFKDTGKF
jgi:ketosteroid isomerase-like protein